MPLYGKGNYNNYKLQLIFPKNEWLGLEVCYYKLFLLKKRIRILFFYKLPNQKLLVNNFSNDDENRNEYSVEDEKWNNVFC